MKYIKILQAVILSLVFAATFSFAQDDKMKDEKQKEMMKEKSAGMMHDNMTMRIDKNEDGIAIEGYDPVAYFTEGKPVKGKSQFSYKWNDAEWHFASEKHLTLFKESPGKYAPQYGGFCAYGVSENHCGHTDPTAWKIIDGKLYLTTNKNVKMIWEKDIDGHIEKGDKNWIMLNKED